MLLLLGTVILFNDIAVIILRYYVYFDSVVADKLLVVRLPA